MIAVPGALQERQSLLQREVSDRQIALQRAEEHAADLANQIGVALCICIHHFLEEVKPQSLAFAVFLGVRRTEHGRSEGCHSAEIAKKRRRGVEQRHLRNGLFSAIFALLSHRYAMAARRTQRIATFLVAELRNDRSRRRLQLNFVQQSHENYIQIERTRRYCRQMTEPSVQLHEDRVAVASTGTFVLFVVQTALVPAITTITPAVRNAEDSKTELSHDLPGAAQLADQTRLVGIK